MTATLERVTGAKGMAGYVFWCPGCKEPHAFWTEYKDQSKRWTFNGDLDRPTFTPSLVVRTLERRCHLYLTDGKLQYLGDCSHELAGKTVQLEPLPWPTD